MSQRRPASSGRKIPEYPEYERTYGEDPARWLFANDQTLKARIQGLRDLGLVQAFLDVETDRDEPRKGVVAALNRKQSELREQVAADGGQR